MMRVTVQRDHITQMFFHFILELTTIKLRYMLDISTVHRRMFEF